MFLGIPWFILASICFIISIIYFFIWPKELVSSVPFWQFVILRWFHSLVWILLTIASLMQYSFSADKVMIGKTLSFFALIIYIIFITIFAFKKVK